MSVSNGEAVEAVLVNSRFVSRTQNSSTAAILGLLRASGSGNTITDAQLTVNNLLLLMGVLQSTNAFDFASENYITDGDTVKEALEALDAAVFSSTNNVSALSFDYKNDSTAGLNVTLDFPTGVILNMIGAAVEIAGITAPSFGSIIILNNKTGTDLTILNEAGSATAEDRLLTSTGLDLTISNGGNALLFYDVVSERWRILSGSGGGGGGALAVQDSIGTPLALAVGDAVSVSGNAQRSLHFIEGSGGHIEITANPQIVAGTIIGQELILYGSDNDATVTYNDGNGLSLNGSATLGLNQQLALLWNGNVWSEMWRR
jgi:hypothetical protein